MMFEVDHNEGRFCIPPLKKTPNIIDCSINDSFDFGSALQNVYPLLNLIFERLPFKDLQSAALVNEMWGKYAEGELKKRILKPSWISLCSTKKNTKQWESSRNFAFDEMSFALIFYDYRYVKLSKFVCSHQATEAKRMTFAEYFSDQIIPTGVDFWTFSCRILYCIQDMKEHRPSFTGLFLPSIPKVNVRKFYCSTKISSAIQKTITDNIPSNNQIKCLLLFKVALAPEEKILNFILEKQDYTTLALAGGVISGGIKLFQHDITPKVYSTRGVYCICFTEEENADAEFDAYSLVIYDESDFEDKLFEFKKRISMRKHSIALRMCCAAKEDKDKETAFFKKQFANTILIGFDVDGEIGWDKYPELKSGDETPEKRRKVIPDSSHQYSSVIVILTWGNVI